jgi:hypothetical protein
LSVWGFLRWGPGHRGEVGPALLSNRIDRSPRAFGQPHEPPREPEALTEVGFTIPAGGVTYWVGEAMGEKEYKDLAKPPKAFAKWTPMLASNAAHLARLLKAENYPGIEGGR